MRILLVLLTALCVSCATGPGAGALPGKSFTLRVLSGSIHLHVESRVVAKPQNPFGTKDDHPRPAGAEQAPASVLNDDLVLAAGQTYSYSLGPGEQFGALVEKIGDVDAVIRVEVNGVDKEYTLPKDSAVGRTFSVSTATSP